MQLSNLKGRSEHNFHIQKELQHPNCYGHSVEELDVHPAMLGRREYDLFKSRTLAVLEKSSLGSGSGVLVTVSNNSASL